MKNLLLIALMARCFHL